MASLHGVLLPSVIYTNESVGVGVVVLGIIGLVLIHKWSHCNDCMHCFPSYKALAETGP